jgi:hypothetical protein
VKIGRMGRVPLALALVGTLAAVLGLARPAHAAGPSVVYSYDPSSPVAQANAPLRVVLVGFKKGQVDENALLAQLPASQRPGVLIPYDQDAGATSDQCGVFFGLNTLINHGR